MDTLFGKVMKIVSLANDWKNFTQSLIRSSPDAFMDAVKFAKNWLVDLFGSSIWGFLGARFTPR